MKTCLLLLLNYSCSICYARSMENEQYVNEILEFLLYIENTFDTMNICEQVVWYLKQFIRYKHNKEFKNIM